MSYAEEQSVETGVTFKTPSGLTVKTTGSSKHVESNGIYVHEVVIVDGPWEGNKFLHNLDYAEPL